jgi:hypothetical protein
MATAVGAATAAGTAAGRTNCVAGVKPGTPLGTSAVARADGKMTAQRLQVGKDGVRPPQ